PGPRAAPRARRPSFFQQPPCLRAGRALAGLLLLAAAASQAAARSLTIESFDVDVRVARDASIDVTETVRPRFEGAWNGIYRTIPVDYRTPQGFGYRL